MIDLKFLRPNIAGSAAAFMRGAKLSDVVRSSFAAVAFLSSAVVVFARGHNVLGAFRVLGEPSNIGCRLLFRRSGAHRSLRSSLDFVRIVFAPPLEGCLHLIGIIASPFGTVCSVVVGMRRFPFGRCCLSFFDKSAPSDVSGSIPTFCMSRKTGNTASMFGSALGKVTAFAGFSSEVSRQVQRYGLRSCDKFHWHPSLGAMEFMI